eukprot:RCo043816
MMVTRKSRPPFLRASTTPNLVDSQDLWPEISKNGKDSLSVKLADGRFLAVTPRGVSAFDDCTGTTTQTLRYSDLIVGRIVGRGSQATVRKVKATSTGRVYAMKCIPVVGSSAETVQLLQCELSRLVHADHPNIVTYYNAFFVGEKLKVLPLKNDDLLLCKIVMEYMDAGTVSALLRDFGPFPMDVLGML